jgi:tryptophanyl-tRNA synthetase
MAKLQDTVFTGLQPTGPLHIGNYLGTLRNCLRLQDEYAGRCYISIVDYHAITEDYEPKEKPRQSFELAAEFLALGLDPKKCVIYVQSDVPVVTELAWIFNTITPMSSLERMTQFKDKASRQTKNINVGLFSYPVLQTADVLLPRANLVPVGQDQVQHVELMRDIARFFNRKFCAKGASASGGGETFPEPKVLLTKVPKVMSLLDPEKKMSKSVPGSFISLADEPEVIRKKVMRAVTDTGPVDAKQKSPGVQNLFLLLREFGGEEDVQKFETDYEKGTVKYSQLKEVLGERISDYFSDFRTRRAELLRNPKKVEKVLKDGAKKMQQAADETMKLVRARVGLTRG